MSSWFSSGASFLRRSVVNPFVASIAEKASPKRAQRGLWGGKKINFGNNVSHSGKKTRKRWSPNIVTKRLWSDCFDSMLRLKVSTYVLRTIDKKGGLDNYLAETPDEKLDSRLGSFLKEQVLEQRRRILLGQDLLPPPSMSDIAYKEKRAAMHEKWLQDHRFDK
uniref:Large ribosomal subunit protein bL28c n=1 Tax=Hemiselmis andersenii TaxID=464988 RepID=A0A6U5A563_HEMAN